MNHLLTAALFFSCLLIPFATPGQSVARLNEAPTIVVANDETNAKAITALQRLEKQVIVYRSLGDFEEDGRLALVSFRTFEHELLEVTNEVQPILARMPESKLRTELTNALASYRDGAFWWGKIDQPRVVHVSALRLESTHTASDTAFLSSTPYTVAIHWRQAHKYLTQAQDISGRTGLPGAAASLR